MHPLEVVLSFPCLFFFIIPPPPISTLFPYTTLFRSRKKQIGQICASDQKHQPHHGHHHRAGKPNLVVHVDAHGRLDRKSTRLNSSHITISYAVFCLKKKKMN